MFLKRLLPSLSILAAGSLLLLIWPHQESLDIYSAQPGQALPGLDAQQKELFAQGKRFFEHEFTPAQGLGPVFNGRSCLECHGSPNEAGLEGRDVVTTGAVHIGNLKTGPVADKDLIQARQQVSVINFDPLLSLGGPTIQRRSITREFPASFPVDCQVLPEMVPHQAQFVSMRHAAPVLGLGLIQAIDESTIVANMIDQARRAPELVGRTNAVSDPLTNTTKIGRFGWKAQQADLLLFTADALEREMGVTSYIAPLNLRNKNIPHCVFDYLPGEPNDKGQVMTMISTFESLLAPPPRQKLSADARQGAAVFNSLKCAVCHTPELTTAPIVEIPDPDSPYPALRYIEIKTLESQPVRLYSDLLLHQMGPELADGIVQGTAFGGEWRTTPLWGLHLKKFYLHNGLALTVDQAICAHGGQAQAVKEAYVKLPANEKRNLLQFLQSL